MLQKETVTKWKSRSLKNNTDQQRFLKIHVLHLSQPVLVLFICTPSLSSLHQTDHSSYFIDS